MFSQLEHRLHHQQLPSAKNRCYHPLLFASGSKSSLVCFGFHLFLSLLVAFFISLGFFPCYIRGRSLLSQPITTHCGCVLECWANIRASQHLKRAPSHHKSSLFLQNDGSVLSFNIYFKLKLSFKGLCLEDPSQNLQSGF
ncbi:hypothetical protein ATANTOWER_015511 [Ataeniobius toweri]|uniref:Uncharacterized protein n=1 Tax=Ataeniobius toweri TaxID=208326 RepID=A0ABU7BRH4_9TELE|nr:hypothetical protein [Ataeniobius toweri]